MPQCKNTPPQIDRPRMASAPSTTPAMIAPNVSDPVLGGFVLVLGGLGVIVLARAGLGWFGLAWAGLGFHGSLRDLTIS